MSRRPWVIRQLPELAVSTSTAPAPGQRLDDRWRVAARGMDRHEDAPTLDLALERVGSRLGHAGAREHRGQAAGRMTHSLAEIRRQRPCGNDRADAGHHERDGGEDLAAELPKARGRARVFDVGAGRGVHLLRERACLLVIPGHDGDLIAPDAQRVQGASAGGGPGRSRVEARTRG